MAGKLVIKSIIPINQQEYTNDEVRLMVDGVEIWDGSMSQGNPINFAQPLEVEYKGSANIQLWEDDFSKWWWPDKDDFMGQNIVHESDHEGGDYTLNFHGSGAHYQIVLDNQWQSDQPWV